MIQIGSTTLDFSDPLTLGLTVGALLALFVVVLLFIAVRRAGQSTRITREMLGQMGRMSHDVGVLGDSQHTLAANIKHVSDQQAQGQERVMQSMERRLAEVNQQVAERLADNALKSARSMSDMQERMKETLTGSSEKTTKSLTELQERLATIDRAQTNIEKLSGDVLTLQDILSNKQTRGAFGEIQLTDIVGKALPADSFTLQATLSNGKRADCLVHLPNPPARS